MPSLAICQADPPIHLGLARLASHAFRGEDLAPLVRGLESRLRADPRDAAAWLDLGLLHELGLRPGLGLACQARALELRQAFRIEPARPVARRLLMFTAPGAINANVPLQFLLQDSDVRLDLLFVRPGHPVPARVPEHDLALVGIAESDANRPLLEAVAAALPAWPRPVLLDPHRVLELARDRLWRRLEGVPGLRVPRTARLRRSELARCPETGFPLIIRPTGSHSGKGLKRVDDLAGLREYLQAAPAETFFVSPFVDYRSPDGLYRKYRVVLVEGRPFLAHMAVAPHWMIHYLNAGMVEHAERRAMEEEAFRTFDEAFAVRHEGALEAISRLLGLDYVSLDCAEMPSGELLVFEADTAMVVHAMDPPDVFPYKRSPMGRIFVAFRKLIDQKMRSQNTE